MRRCRRSLISISIVAVLLGPGASQATADDSGTGSAGAYVDRADGPTAVAGTVTLRPTKAGAGGGGGDVSNCEWRVVVEDDRAFAIYGDDGKRQYSPTGRWFERVCGGQSAAVGGNFPVAEGQTPPVDPAVLAVQARKSVRVATPVIETSPEADRRLYTQVPTWLWLDEEWWQSYSATASAGGIAATVTARPVRSVWSTGDGGRVTCEGSGVAWRPGMPEGASDCRHVYRHSSATKKSGTYALQVTVDFEVTWESSVGAGGTLAGITRSAARVVEVGEIQAIETE